MSEYVELKQLNEDAPQNDSIAEERKIDDESTSDAVRIVEV